MGAIHFHDLPFEFMMPASSNNARDIALKTIPSASKVLYKSLVCLLRSLKPIPNYFCFPRLEICRQKSSGFCNQCMVLRLKR